MRTILFTLLFGFSAIAAASPQVVVTIKPLQLLVSSLTQGEVDSQVLVKPLVSPHDYTLRPSDVRKINSADLVLWVGEELEPFMVKPLSQKSNGIHLALMSQSGMPLIGAEEGEDHQEHDAHDEEHHGHDEHAAHKDHDDHDHHEHHEHEEHAAHKDEHHEHEHEEHAAHQDEHHEDEHGHDHHGHNHTVDPHIWLGFDTAVHVAEAITEQLIALEPEQQAKHSNNLVVFKQRLAKLHAELKQQIAPYHDTGYFVFHDAYGYFERSMGIKRLGEFTVNPQQRPGAKTLSHIREELEEGNALCIFAEPQFDGAVLQTISKDTKAYVGQLDPIATEIENGAEAYYQFLRAMADDFSDCLSHQPQA